MMRSFTRNLILMILIASMTLAIFGCTYTKQKHNGYPDTPDEVWGDLEKHEGGRVWDTLTNEQQALVHYPKFDNECVYWVSKGNSYHAIDWCYTLTKSNVIRSGSLDEAILAGKADPCSKCVGHR